MRLVKSVRCLALLQLRPAGPQRPACRIARAANRISQTSRRWLIRASQSDSQTHPALGPRTNCVVFWCRHRARRVPDKTCPYCQLQWHQSVLSRLPIGLHICSAIGIRRAGLWLQSAQQRLANGICRLARRGVLVLQVPLEGACSAQPSAWLARVGAVALLV